MEPLPSSPDQNWNARLASLVSFLLVSLMVACIVSTLLVIIRLIYPMFPGSYLIPICILLGLEASLSQRRLRGNGFPQPRWVAYRTAEFVTIFLGLRILVYWMVGINQLWVDIGGWPETFWGSLLPMEFMIILFLAFLAWGANHMLADDILQLESDEEKINKEMLGVEVIERSQAQQRLRDMVVFMGCGLILATAIIRIAGWSNQASSSDIRQTFINVVLYFLFALVLFSLTHFSVLRMNWIVQHSQVSRSIGSRWIIFSSSFIILLAIFAGILPTSYSMGLLGTLNTLFFALLNGVRFLLSIILLPFVWLINWLMSLFGSPDTPEAAAPIPTPVLTLNRPLFQGDWIELLKSALFWITFIGLVVFSLYYLAKENQGLLRNFRRYPIIQAILDVLEKVSAWFKQGLGQITKGVETSLEFIRRPFRHDKEKSAWQFLRPRDLSHRQQVIFYYLTMLRRGGEHGVPRLDSQTPLEYAVKLTDALQHSELVDIAPAPDIQAEVISLTDKFLVARYSQHPTSPEDAGQARENWVHIRRIIQRLLPARSVK